MARWAGTRVVARWRRGARRRLAVVAGLACFVTGSYVVVVLGGGALLGRTESPSVALSVGATAAVALGFAPVQAALERAAARRWDEHGTPYDALRRFSRTATDGYPIEDLPLRMSMLLAQGTGAAWAQVWLTVGDQLTLAATWPADVDADGATPPYTQPGARDGTGTQRRALPVRHGGVLLAVLRVQERPGLPLTSVEERLFSGLAAQAGHVLQQVSLRADLEARHEELEARAEELRASRKRLIEAQDAARQRLERDMHDGAQQHLVALAVNLQLAETVAARSPARALRVLAEQADAVQLAIETIASLARGISPRQLSDDGLIPALRSALAGSPLPATVETDGRERLPADVEAALYFCCLEAVQNAAKHSAASSVAVRLSEAPAGWQLTVADDGTGFDEAHARAARTGAGLCNMADRLDAVGGTVTIRSRSGGGTTVTAEVPRARMPSASAGTARLVMPAPRPAV